MDEQPIYHHIRGVGGGGRNTREIQEPICRTVPPTSSVTSVTSTSSLGCVRGETKNSGKIYPVNLKIPLGKRVRDFAIATPPHLAGVRLSPYKITLNFQKFDFVIPPLWLSGIR